MVRRMMAALRHRGQDDEAVLAALHAQLAIGLPKHHGSRRRAPARLVSNLQPCDSLVGMPC
jgi:asparagine synthetase B (glutamine-hydrolysing)